jgi:hypothetical protein
MVWYLWCVFPFPFLFLVRTDHPDFKAPHLRGSLSVFRSPWGQVRLPFRIFTSGLLQKVHALALFVGHHRET